MPTDGGRRGTACCMQMTSGARRRATAAPAAWGPGGASIGSGMGAFDGRRWRAQRGSSMLVYDEAYR